MTDSMTIHKLTEPNIILLVECLPVIKYWALTFNYLMHVYTYIFFVFFSLLTAVVHITAEIYRYECTISHITHRKKGQQTYCCTKRFEFICMNICLYFCEIKRWNKANVCNVWPCVEVNERKERKKKKKPI